MLAIIDGGSTKADWRIAEKNAVPYNFTTIGFNPNYDSIEAIREKLQDAKKQVALISSPDKIYYYGAGCWDPKRQAIVKEAFLTLFPTSQIIISHDLLAAARATCGNEPGIACILGTGSNSVLYNGYKEVDNVTNLGFILGDEGSGAIIGKNIVKSYFYREMPKELCPIIEQECPNGKIDILNKVYSGGIPAAYLASFTKLFTSHKTHPFVWNLVKKTFKEFLERHVMKYENHEKLPIHFVGSIAYHYSEILEELCLELELNLGKILQRPIESLFEYHQNH